MSPSTARRVLLAGVIVVSVLPAPGPSRGVAHQAQNQGTCSVRGEITLSSKIACLLEPVEARIALHPICAGAIGNPPPFRSLHVLVQLPEPIEPVGRPPDGSWDSKTTLEWRFDVSADVALRDVITATQRIRSSRPGIFSVGRDAQVWLEDSEGHTVDGTLIPATLTVRGCAPPAGAQVLLPLAYRPSCVPSPQPADIVLAMDRSTSVGATGLADAGRWARAFLDSVDVSRDRVAVIGFAERAALLAPLTSDRAGLEQALDRLSLAPGTRIERAIDLAVAELAGDRARPGRRRMVAIISDGVQTGPGGAQVVLEAAQRARLRGVAILTVALGTVPDRKLLSAVSADPARNLYAPTVDDLQRAYRELADVAACAQ